MLRILSLLVLLVPLAFSAEGPWMTDFEAAKAKAKAEGKDLLIDFTGSDWCHWCVKLKEEVFDHDSFVSGASKSFIFVELDFPRKKELDPKLKAQNEKLRDQFKIEGYPTIILANHEGVEYARTGYQAGGPTKYIEHLEGHREQKAAREALFKDAMAATGDEKAQKLSALLDSLIKDRISAGQKEIADEIKKLDPEDKKGYLDNYKFHQNMMVVQKQLNTDGNLDTALATLANIVKTNTNKAHQQKVYLFMAEIYNRGKKDQEQTLAHYKKAADADPESETSKQIYAYLEKQGAGKKEE